MSPIDPGSDAGKVTRDGRDGKLSWSARGASLRFDGCLLYKPVRAALSCTRRSAAAVARTAVHFLLLALPCQARRRRARRLLRLLYYYTLFHPATDRPSRLIDAGSHIPPFDKWREHAHCGRRAMKWPIFRNEGILHHDRHLYLPVKEPNR